MYCNFFSHTFVVKNKSFNTNIDVEYCRCVKLLFQVELLGYASGDDHLYLVYEYVQNGSLSDHLHDPLKRGTLNYWSISFVGLS